MAKKSEPTVGLPTGEELDLPAPDSEEPFPTDEVAETFTLSDDEFEDEVEYDPFEHQKAKGAHFPSAWVTGPGAVELLAEASRLLVTTTELKGELQEQLTHVHVTALRTKRCLVVAPSNDKDLKGLEVTWREGHALFVASKILIRAGFPVETGHRERYKVHLLENSKKGPVLVIDMRSVKAVKVLKKRKRGKGKEA